MKLHKRTRILLCIFCAIVFTFTIATTAFADDDPISVVNNLSSFIFGFIRAIGIILLGFGILQLGLSLKSHDPSQRANGMLTIAGGIVITFTIYRIPHFFVVFVACFVVSTNVKVVAPSGVGGTLLPSTRVISVLLPLGRYCPETGAICPVLTLVM